MNDGGKNLFFRWCFLLRLFLKDIMLINDIRVEFSWKKKLWFDIGKSEVENMFRSCSSNCILFFFKSCVKEGFEI